MDPRYACGSVCPTCMRRTAGVGLRPFARQRVTQRQCLWQRSDLDRCRLHLQAALSALSGLGGMVREGPNPGLGVWIGFLCCASCLLSRATSLKEKMDDSISARRYYRTPLLPLITRRPLIDIRNVCTFSGGPERWPPNESPDHHQIRRRTSTWWEPTIWWRWFGSGGLPIRPELPPSCTRDRLIADAVYDL